MEVKVDFVSEQSGTPRLKPDRTTEGSETRAPWGNDDLSDGGRKPLEWQSRYPPEAQKLIWQEVLYLLALTVVVIPTTCFAFWLDYPKSFFNITDTKYSSLVMYAFGAAGGMLGGALFAAKWLYHVVARQWWHMDRRPWRFMTPILSAGLACAMIALATSGILRIFDRAAFQAPSAVFGFAFLVGYFSDGAAAKLTELASTLFGPHGKDDKTAKTNREGKDASQNKAVGSNGVDATPPQNQKRNDS